MMRPEETIILVPSCYNYRDCWKPFCKLLNKYWPKRKFLTILVTDIYKDVEWEGDSIIELKKDLGWCRNLSTAIRQESLGGVKNILLLQEDFFLSGPVDTEAIDRAIRYLDADPIVGCFRLYPCPGPDSETGEPGIGLVHKDAPYAVSCQAAIWKTDYILRILDQFDTPWEFEILGTNYQKKYLEKVTVSYYREANPWPLQYICTAIVKGKWQSGAVAWCKANGVDLDLSLRPIE
jgi:hypothetical protein